MASAANECNADNVLEKGDAIAVGRFLISIDRPLNENRIAKPLLNT